MAEQLMIQRSRTRPASRLNSGFFTYLDCTEASAAATNDDNNSDQVVLAAYAPVDHPMVLYSRKDGTPLVAITLRARTQPVTGSGEGPTPDVRTLITRRKPTPANPALQFQGLVAADESHIEFALTNLLPHGFVCVNLMRSGATRVGEIDPGPIYGINKVNELSPQQTYVIRADQSNERMMILVAMRAFNATTSALERVTVRSAESASTPISYSIVYPVVTPQADSPYTEFFSDVEWRECPEVLVVRTKAAALSRPRLSGLVPQSAAIPLGMFNESMEARLESFSPSTASIRTVRASAFSSLGPSRGSAESAMVLYSDDDHGVEECCMLDEISVPQRAPVDTRQRARREPTVAAAGTTTTRTESQEKGRRVLESASHVVSSLDAQDTVMDSYAANIQFGERYTEDVRDTGLTYKFEYNSPSCAISLSVCTKIAAIQRTALPSDTDLSSALEETKLAVYKPLRIFKADDNTCSICFADGSDTVVCRCGHAAFHRQCLDACLQVSDRCPLCRRTIVITLPLSAFDSA